MIIKKPPYWIFTLLPLFLFTENGFSVATGKIVGTIKDAATGKPLPGINVVIQGTSMGAATDINGDFIILRVPVGTYKLKAMMIGYKQVIIQDVKVMLDLTTRVDFEMEETILEAEEVIIVAKRPLVQKDVTTSMTIIDNDRITSMAIDDYTDIIAINPGMTRDAKGFHLRGGRQREVVFEVDGVVIQEPNYGTSFSGISAVSLSNNAISELVVQSGGFNAEFGNALSGVVNVTTREGSNQFSGFFELESELDIDPGKEIPLEKLDPRIYGDAKKYDYYTGFRRYRLGLGGPLFQYKPIKYFASVEWTKADDGFPSREKVNNDFNELLLNAKISYDIASNISLKLNGMVTRKSYFLYDARRKYIPDTFQFRDYKVDHFSFHWTHLISSTIYYSIVGGYSNTYYKAAQKDKWWDITQPYSYNVIDTTLVGQPKPNGGVWQSPVVVGGDTLENPQAVNLNDRKLPGTYYEINSDNNLFREEYIKTYLIKSNLTSQLGKHHQVKSGIEVNIYDLYYQAVLAYYGFPFTFAHSLGRNDLNLPKIYPKLYAFYLQDKIEFEGMIMNAGVRLEAFDPDASLPSDFYRPYYDERPFGPPEGPDDPDIANWKGANHDIPSPRDWKRASIKYMISPRIGVSHPITDRHVLHFTYGHFYQIPDWYYLYRNYNYSFDVLALGGNPDLKPERTISYEVGVKSAITDNIITDMTVFYKDISNLTETYMVINPNDEQYLDIIAGDTTASGERRYSVIEYPLWFNNENIGYGNVKGFEFNLRKIPSLSDHLGLVFSYTFMIARGKTSDYHDGFLRVFTRGQLDPVQQYFLNWDQRHTVAFNIDYRKPDNYGANLLFTYGSGLPYTGYQESILPIENNHRLPHTWNVDLKLNKAFNIRGVKADFYLLVTNLFDTQNVVNFDNGENRRIPVISHLRDHPEEFEGPLDDPTVFGSHREIKAGMSYRF